MPAELPTKLTHPMSPMVERFAVPLAYVALGILVGMYLARKKAS